MLLLASVWFAEQFTKRSRWMESSQLDEYRKWSTRTLCFTDSDCRMRGAITSSMWRSLANRIDSSESLNYHPHLPNGSYVLSEVTPTFCQLLHILGHCFLTSGRLCPLENTTFWRNLSAQRCSLTTKFIVVSWQMWCGSNFAWKTSYRRLISLP